MKVIGNEGILLRSWSLSTYSEEISIAHFKRTDNVVVHILVKFGTKSPKPRVTIIQKACAYE